jgi:hypothetical protein
MSIVTWAAAIGHHVGYHELVDGPRSDDREERSYLVPAPAGKEVLGPGPDHAQRARRHGHTTVDGGPRIGDREQIWAVDRPDDL